MSVQQDEKIQELADKNRGLVDEVSRLARELRNTERLYNDALRRLHNAESALEARMVVEKQFANHHPQFEQQFALREWLDAKAAQAEKTMTLAEQAAESQKLGLYPKKEDTNDP